MHRYIPRTGKILAVSIILLWSSQAAHAQVLYGSIVGNIKDPSDAVLAGSRWYSS